MGAAPAITITITAPDQGGAITNNVSVSSDVMDSVPGNDSDSEDTTVTAIADLAITKSDNPDPVIAGNNLGENTAGTFDIYFDGSDVALDGGDDEDVKGAWVDPDTGEIYLTTNNGFDVAGLTGDGNEVFVCDPGSLGENNTSCTFSAFFDADANGFVDGSWMGWP